MDARNPLSFVVPTNPTCTLKRHMDSLRGSSNTCYVLAILSEIVSRHETYGGLFDKSTVSKTGTLVISVMSWMYDPPASRSVSHSRYFLRLVILLSGAPLTPSETPETPLLIPPRPSSVSASDARRPAAIPREEGLDRSSSGTKTDDGTPFSQ